MKRTTLALAILTMAAMLAMASAARAVDGVIEINQAKVIAAGGFPYKITTSGSYRLTGNLTGIPVNTDSILVTPSNVTIDLNGFSISGPGATTGRGIAGFLGSQITVENGTVTNFTGSGVGVFLGANSIVKNVHADSNFSGIIAYDRSVIEGCTANSNSSLGIECDGSYCVISSNAANANVTGIYCNGDGCAAIGNTLNGNTSYGLLTLFATTGYGQNVFFGNGTNVIGGHSMGNNVCSGATC